MAALNIGLGSATSCVSVGSRTSIGPSRAVRNNEDCPRTRSDTPSQVSSRPPSLEGSTRRTSHSSSRTTIRAPGAMGVFVTIVLPARQPTVAPMRPGNFGASSGAGIAGHLIPRAIQGPPDHRRPAMSDSSPFTWRHFEADIMLYAARWYLRYALSDCALQCCFELRTKFQHPAVDGC